MSSTPIRILIADDHDVYRDGLKLLIGKHQDMVVVGEAENGEKLISLARQLTPDVILTDLRMPIIDGTRAIRAIHEFNKDIRIIIISSFDREDMIVNALEAGAIGYIVKNAQKGEIEDAVLTVFSYTPYYCRSTSQRLVKLISNSSFNPYKNKKTPLFSEREKQIIQLICQEKTSKEIGLLIFTSDRTVEKDRRTILEKMNVRTSAGVALFAVKNGLYFIKE